MPHAYPHDLAALCATRLGDVTMADPRFPVPGQRALVELLSTAYQATLLREEERPVTFRLLVAEPEAFPAGHGPPTGLHRLVFTTPRPFTEHELRRLSPAVKYHRALIGIRPAGEGFEIWGMLQSGPQWLQGALGGRAAHLDMTDAAIVVSASGPGRLAVSRGSTSLGEMRGGSLTPASMDVFESRWLRARFVDVRNELGALHAAAQARASGPWASLDPDVTRTISQQMIKRLVALMRSTHHGGTLIVLPPECAGLVCFEGRYLHPKYSFVDDEPRRRYRSLMLDVMGALGELGGRLGRVVGWEAYEGSRTPALAALDEAIFEVSHLIAGLADVDGAVVITKRFELLGFGAEIVGDLPDVPYVQRALDVEGSERVSESIDGVGTRHRSAYRLCQQLHEALTVVVSQDGNVRFAAWHDGAVTYWDHVPTGPLDT
jgi:hypothetical protein